jgi:hypothetical protein
MSDYQCKYKKYINKNYKIKPNKIINQFGSGHSYQNIIYEIAKYIKPNMSHKFKNNFGLKQLSNQVIELNKTTFANELQNEIKNYYMTDKIDGKRTILYLDKNESYAVSDILENIDIKTNSVCILDTELYEGEYYVFDVMVCDGEILIDLPFEDRMKYFDKFTKTKNIKLKHFVKLTSEYKKQIKKFKEEKKPYETDGIILTPAKGNYVSMKVYKYKPPQHLTIDFLIKKCPEKLRHKMHNYIDNKKKTSYILFCGINKRVYFRLRMRLIEYYENIFENIEIKNLPQYFPIQFEPSSDKHAYLFCSDDDNLDNEVGEFLYDIKNKEWILKKVRKDRKIEVERGNYFGNNYKTAEFIWMAVHDPLIIEEEKEDDGEDVYFQEHDNVLQKASRNYNSFVKSELFDKFKGTNWVLDLASGKGQDLFRYSTFNMRNVIFLEIDKVALTELISRKHSFSTDDKYNNPMNILIQNVDLLDDYKDNIEKINNVYTKRNIDLIMCNFAFHYFVKDKKSLKNICKLINHYLNKNGKFVFTAFDGQEIVELLEKNNGEWIIKVDDKIKYGIKKAYKNDKLLKIGQKIEVLLPFSKNTFYEEYLINIKTIEKELKKYDIVLETNKSFLSHIDEYNKEMDDDDKTYVNLYHYYIFTKK